jgi:hypothetical protein
MGKTLRTFLTTGAAAVLALGLTAGSAQAGSWPTSTARHLTRAKVWTSFRSNGSQGPKHWNWQDNNDASLGMQYPGSDVSSRGLEFPEYWGNLGGWTPAMQRQDAASRGEGIWIVTRPPGSTAAKFSISGHRIASSDVVGMIPDPSTDPSLADLGNDNRAPLTSAGLVAETSVIPSGASMSNWWPGQTAIPEFDQPIEIHNHTWFKYMKETVGRDNVAEEVIVSKWTTGNGITATRKSFAWGQPDFDDFIINEVVFENTGDTNGNGVANAGFPVQLTGTYFGFTASYKMSEAEIVLGHHNRYYGDWDDNRRDDWWRYTESPNYLTAGVSFGQAWSAGKPSMVGKDFIYQFDGDGLGIPIDDTGGPYRAAFTNLSCGTAEVIQGQLEDEMLSYHVMGYGPLDIDPTDGFTGDTETYKDSRLGAASQPWGALRHESAFEGWASRAWSDAQYEDQLFKPSDPAEVYQAGANVQGVSNEDLHVTSSFESYMWFGPYDLAPGDKVKIVMTQVAATAVEDNIYAFARSASPDLAAAQILLKNNGVTNLEKHLAAAQWIYDHGYDVPDQPPDVFGLVETNTAGGVDVSWSGTVESAVHSDYGVADVAGYHVYRSNGAWKGHLGPWNLVAVIPKGTEPNSPDFAVTYNAGANTYTMQDLTAQAGFAYWYSVRTYAEGHGDWTGDVVANAEQGTFANLPAYAANNLGNGLESSSGSPESKTLREFRPLLPGNTAADNLSIPVRVVPNPFKLDQVHAYGRTRNIRFTNIPRRAKISIFSISGDLITEIIHDDPTTTPPGIDNPAEVTWTQGSRSGLGVIAPGMYFYVVEALDSNKSVDGTFMIVR